MNTTTLNKRSAAGKARQMNVSDWAAVLKQYQAGATLIRLVRSSVAGVLVLERPEVEYIAERFLGWAA